MSEFFVSLLVFTHFFLFCRKKTATKWIAQNQIKRPIKFSFNTAIHLVDMTVIPSNSAFIWFNNNNNNNKNEILKLFETHTLIINCPGEIEVVLFYNYFRYLRIAHFCNREKKIVHLIFFNRFAFFLSLFYWHFFFIELTCRHICVCNCDVIFKYRFIKKNKFIRSH